MIWPTSILKNLSLLFHLIKNFIIDCKAMKKCFISSKSNQTSHTIFPDYGFFNHLFPYNHVKGEVEIDFPLLIEINRLLLNN